MFFNFLSQNYPRLTGVGEIGVFGPYVQKVVGAERKHDFVTVISQCQNLTGKIAMALMLRLKLATRRVAQVSKIQYV